MIAILLVCGLLSLAQLWATNRLATQGEELKELQLAAVRIEAENQVLTNQVTTLGSLTRIASDSAALGFVEVGEYLYLSPPPRLALGNKH